MISALLRPAVRFACLVALAGTTPWSAGAVEPPSLVGFLRLGGGVVDAPASFLDGGFGKRLAGGAPADSRDALWIGETRLALDWEPSPSWRFFVHGVARRDARARASSSGSGLLEAFVELRHDLDARWSVRARAGSFFLPVSLENVDPLWTSPYTITLSALNSWVAEEVRPTGIDFTLTRATRSDHRLSVAATLFGGNDSSGALVAWRGFALHDRPTPIGRSIPIPPVPGFAVNFPLQSRSGSTPFENDLDGRLGISGRAGWEAPGGRARVHATAFLNRGDRRLHGDEYAWDTDFRWLGVQVEPLPGLRLLGEWGTGFSLMGVPPPGSGARAAVDIEFDTFYLMASREIGRVRATLRYDHFRVDDRDATPLDDNRERGESWTFATALQLASRWSAIVEWVELSAERPAAPPGVDLGGRSLLGELRLHF